MGYTDGARAFVAGLLDRRRGDGVVVTRGDWWDKAPKSCVNVGFTYAGLKALGLDTAVLKAFPPAFREGPAERAYSTVGDNGDVGLGDVEESDPAHWIMGGPNTPEV